MAFLGLSFRFCAAPPPNQPQIPDILPGRFEDGESSAAGRAVYIRTKSVRRLSSVAGDGGDRMCGGMDGGVRRKQAAV